MKKFVLLMLLLAIPNLSSGKAKETSSKIQELQTLIKQVEQLNDNTNQQINTVTQQSQEKYYKNKLAVLQAKLLILDTTTYIYQYLDGARNFNDIYEIVASVYECSYIFPELGWDHLDAFTRILSWSDWETRFNKNLTQSWKKGTTIKRCGKILKIKFNSTDYGAWQISNQHIGPYLDRINKLYTSGVITFKVKNVKTMKDVMHVPTNCVARCIIESDRKIRGWEWKHEYDKSFVNKLNDRIYRNLQIPKLYDRQLTQKYYHLVPIKIYKGTFN